MFFNAPRVVEAAGISAGLWFAGGAVPRHVAALDATDKGRTRLASYYTERGESPGVWVGSGMEGIDALTSATQ